MDPHRPAQWYEPPPPGYPWATLYLPVVFGHEDAKQCVDSIKLVGNQCLRDGQYYDAIWKYSHALELCRERGLIKEMAVLHGNTALACLKMGDCFKPMDLPPQMAIWYTAGYSHACGSIQLDPCSDIIYKAYFRRAEAARKMLGLFPGGVVPGFPIPLDCAAAEAVSDYIHSHQLHENVQAVCEAIILAVDQGQTHLIPALQDSNVQSGFCTNLLREVVSHHDTRQNHINFVVLEMRVVSYSLPFDASSFQLTVLLKKPVRHLPLLKRMFELGMTVKEEDVRTALGILPDDRTDILQLILTNFKFEPTFFKAVQKAVQKSSKRQLLSCLNKHVPHAVHGACDPKDEESTVHFEEALENGYVECTMTTCVVTGAAGSGKSHTMYLALNEGPPDVRQSTGLVEPVRALSTVVGSSQSGSLEWHRVDEDKVLGMVAGATSVTNADHIYSASEESFSTSLPPATPQAPLATPQTPLATPQAMRTRKQPESFSEAAISEQVSKSELTSHTEVVDEQLTKLAGLLKKPVGRRQVTKLDFLYFLDSGGQPHFHELLSSFIPNLSTIMFVLKLSEKLSHHPVIEYYKEGKSICSYQSPHSHEQILKHCIRALQPEKWSIESSSSSTPSIAVVGTHKDLEPQCEGETRDEKNQKLLDLLQPRFGDSLIFYHHLKELIYPVNAKNPDKGDKVVAGKLVEAIIHSSAPKPVQIPLPWFMLEQVLRKLAIEKGTGVMHIDECREIASRLHIKPSAFYAALKYLVSLNLFLYYPTVLPGVVFCVPQIFLDKINELVQYRHFLCGRSSTLPGSAESTSPTGLSGKHWLQFQNHGVFHEKFLQEKAFSAHYDEDLFTPADFLKLLESLLIVGRVNTTDINIEYVMPSLLFELKSEKLGEHRCDPVTSQAAPLLVYFPGKWPTSGVFCSFLASLLSTQNWEVMVDARKKPICLYRNCFKFRHPLMAGSITLIDSFDRGYFEVHVKAPPGECIKHCPEIRKSVFAALPPKAPVQAEVAFFCPNSKKKDACCRSSLHLADTKSRNYWSCSENPEEVGSLAETLNMTVWGVTRTSASEEQEHGCQNPTVGAQLSGSVGQKLSNCPGVYQLKKLKGKEGRTVKVIEQVAAEWEQLAYTLQFSPAVVRTVERDTTDCTAACMEVLYRWIKGAEGTRRPVNWATLIECLRDCDFVMLARDLENVLCEH